MAKQDISLDIPTEEGRVVYGAVVTASEFQATVRPPLFRTIVPDPFRLESRALDTHHPELVEVAEMRRRVQRLIERAKKSNVPDYAAYIYAKAKAGEGFTPQVVLWTPRRSSCGRRYRCAPSSTNRRVSGRSSSLTRCG